jgi:hypothetical protein
VFSNCTSLTNINFSPLTTAVGESEFSGCTALASLAVPTNITSLGSSAFQNCPALTGVYFQGNAPTADTTVFNGDNSETNYYFPKTFGWGATFAGRPTVPILFDCTTNASAITIKSYIGLDGSVTIPATLYGLPVTALGNGTFHGCNTVTNVLVSSNLTSIAGQAFVDCTNLLAINVDINNPVYSSINGILFDKSQDTILYYPGGRPGSYTLPDGVTTIATYAFQACFGLTTLIVPASVTDIGTLSFNADPELTAIYFEGSAPTVEWSAFDIPNNVIAFYLPGTTNWEVNFGGLPTTLWLPQIQTEDGSFGIHAQQFGFNISWASGPTVIIEACTNLAQYVWIPLATNTLSSNMVYFGDPLWTNYPVRYYRAYSP